METRINKFIKDCGIASRREADRLLAEGRVFVNGKPAEIGMLVRDGDVISVDGKVIRLTGTKHIIAFYKPVGVTCTKKDEHAEKTIDDVLDYPYPLTYAGRLDKDSEGLLLLTDDGELIDKLMRARNAHEKEYEVIFKKPLSDEFLKKFAGGVYLKDLEETTRHCKITRTDEKKALVVLTQGLNRQIRRMGSALGNEVTGIKRLRIANILLGDLQPGEYRELTLDEKTTLYKTVGLNAE
jgi:23S rRNA pseudouridine2604 synthase